MSSPKIAALLVGINAYRDAPLRGCVPDALSLSEWLMRERGLKPSATQILTDVQASRQNMLRQLQWLAAQEAEVAIFAFSGHGTRVRDVDYDELDTPYDQAIVPQDYGRAGLILDDDLARIYATFSSRTRLFVLFDSCYSAKAERSWIASVKDRFRRRTPRVLNPALLGEDVLAQTYGVSREWRATPPQNNLLLLSGCRDYETSADAWFGRAAGYRGAFTYHLQRALKILGPKADALAVVEDARRTLAANAFSQVPQLTGPPEWARRPLFT